MKTIFIYDQCCQEDIKFFVVPGDYSHLNNTYINAGDTPEDEEKSDELLSILYSEDMKTIIPQLLDYFPVKEVTQATKVITVGWLP